MGKLKIWAAEYCPCYYESVFGVLSLHRTKAGAQAAVAWHRRKAERKFPATDGDTRKWRVRLFTVKV